MMQHESEGRKRARALIVRTGHHLGKAGGHLHADSDYAADKRMVEQAIREHERHDHPGRPPTKLKLAEGGVADGEEAPSRADRSSRGKKGGHTKINIIVAPGQGGGPQAVPVPVPVPAGGGPALPPRPPMLPPGGPPVMAPRPGMPVGAGMPGAGLPPGAPMMRKDGGRAGRPHMTAGSASGEGRLEKSRQLPYRRGGRAEDCE